MPILPPRAPAFEVTGTGRTLWCALLAIGLAVAGPVRAQEPPPAAPLGRDLAHDLDEAVRAYQLGRRDEARQRFSAIVLDPSPTPLAVRQEARIYLGELAFTDGDQEGARLLYEAIFAEEPSAQIDPFRHPPDVCLFFEYVRLSRPQPPPPPPPPAEFLPRPPVSAWAPFGAYHFGHEHRGRGFAYAGGQLALLTTNLVLVSVLAQDSSYVEGDEAAARRLSQLRGASFAAGTSFYILWATSVFDAHIQWRQDAPPPAPR